MLKYNKWKPHKACKLSKFKKLVQTNQHSIVNTNNMTKTKQDVA